jgi:S-adenosylmethionine hydrolase
MIVLFTDFGPAGPYSGQMKAVLLRDAPGVAVIELMSDAPACDPMASAYLLAALTGDFDAGTVFLGVVDPGVGGARAPVMVEAGGRWFVGPDNGLFAIAARRQGDASQGEARWWRITWRPERLSASFHGRDLFAPVAAGIAKGERPAGEPLDASAVTGADWPDDLARVIYVDHFGNAVTGLRAETLAPGTELAVVGASARFGQVRTFSDAREGEAFWYENANGLAEIAVNRGRADSALGLALGAAIEVHAPASR